MKYTQRLWVEERIGETYAASREVNEVLFEKRDVPPFPEQTAVREAVLKAITPEQVEFMRRSPAPFSFQAKLVASRHREDLLRTLVKDQGKTLGRPEAARPALYIAEPIRKHFQESSSREKKPTWYWEFGQGAAVLGPQRGDDLGLNLEERIEAFKETLPEGMRGTDRYTWATRVATGLKTGTPWDVQFGRDRQVVDDWRYTLMDEEGTFAVKSFKGLAQGSCQPHRDPRIVVGYADVPDNKVVLRASVSGPV